MLDKINFTTKDDTRLFLGRNRHGYSDGIEIWERNNVVRLTPITSRGKVSASCYIDIESKPETLRALAEKLNAMADQIEG